MPKASRVFVEPRDTAPDSLTKGDEIVASRLREARAEWPTIDVAADVFAAYLESCAPGGTRAETLRHLHTSDLYLACACVRGDPHAIDAFERHCLSVVDETLTRMTGVERDVVDEVKQRLRHRLLVADDRPPQLLEFSGRGHLRRWVRVLAVREALAIRRGARRVQPVEDDVLERALRPALDPEVEYLKKLYQTEFTRAVAAAFRGLDADQRTLLRRSFVEGMGLDQLAAVYGVHRATAARRLERAQRALSDRIRELLTERLHVQSSELNSILRFLRSGLQMSMQVLRQRRRARRAP